MKGHDLRWKKSVSTVFTSRMGDLKKVKLLIYQRLKLWISVSNLNLSDLTCPFELDTCNCHQIKLSGLNHLKPILNDLPSGKLT